MSKNCVLVLDVKGTDPNHSRFFYVNMWALECATNVGKSDLLKAFTRLDRIVAFYSGSDVHKRFVSQGSLSLAC